MNKSEKQELLRDAAARSRANPDDIHYVLYGGCFCLITIDAEKAASKMSQGYKLYCKMLDGQMIL